MLFKLVHMMGDTGENANPGKHFLYTCNSGRLPGGGMLECNRIPTGALLGPSGPAQPDRNSYLSSCQQVPSPRSSTRVSRDPAPTLVAGLSFLPGWCQRFPRTRKLRQQGGSRRVKPRSGLRRTKWLSGVRGMRARRLATKGQVSRPPDSEVPVWPGCLPR